MTRFSGIALAALLLAAPVRAQTPGVSIYASGGGYNALKDLVGGAADFKTGFMLATGLDVALNRRLSLRGEFGFARTVGNDLREIAPNLDGTYNRFLYLGEVRLKFPGDRRVAPYVFGGAGGMTIDPELATALPGTRVEHFTKGVGRFGAGVDVGLQRETAFGLFLQVAGLVYSFNRFGADATQLDMTYTAGVSYQLLGR